MKYWIPTCFLLIGLNSFSQGLTQINNVIKQLNLEKSNCKLDLIASKKRPNNPNETIIVIPEIVEEDESYFELNSHIVIVDNTTGVITNKYFESSKTNDWYSDALRLESITIDTAPYKITENKRAFGIRVYYYGSSMPNPYSHETISLFIETEDSLQKILNNFDVTEYSGEWDTNCYGEFIRESKTIGISSEKTNGYFDLIISNKITETNNLIDKNDDCISTEKITKVKTTLTFNSIEYK